MRFLKYVAALSCCTALIACDQRLVENHGNLLPADLAIPQVSGDAQDVAHDLCNWAEANQKPFSFLALETVYVETAIGSNRSEVSLLNVFLQYERNPKTLILPLDLSQRGFGLNDEELAARVTNSGLWSFRKVPLTYCEQSPDLFSHTEFDGLELCIETRLIDTPPEDAIRADYRSLYYRVPVGLFRAPQLVVIKVLSLYRGESLMGRSINVHLQAGPLDAGRTNLNCNPRITPLAFESVE